MSEGAGDCIHQRSRRRDRTGFAAALYPQRIRWAWRIGHLDLEHWQVARTRHAIIHVACREELTGAVVNRPLQHRLANALCDAAMHLAFYDHRIDDGPKIV